MEVALVGSLLFVLYIYANWKAQFQHICTCVIAEVIFQSIIFKRNLMLSYLMPCSKCHICVQGLHSYSCNLFFFLCILGNKHPTSCQAKCQAKETKFQWSKNLPWLNATKRIFYWLLCGIIIMHEGWTPLYITSKCSWGLSYQLLEFTMSW